MTGQVVHQFSPARLTSKAKMFKARNAAQVNQNVLC